MTPSRPHDLHDEEMTPEAFAAEDREHDFGIWPDIAGLILAIAIVWLMFATSDGTF